MAQKALNDKLRNKFMDLIKQSFEQLGEEILIVGSNEFAIPTLDEQNNDAFITIKVSVPTGSRDGEAYDGYALAEEYTKKVAEKNALAEKKAEEKAKKMAKDKANREKLALSKANHQNK